MEDLKVRKSEYSIGDLSKLVQSKRKHGRINGPEVVKFLIQKGFLKRLEGQPLPLPTKKSYQNGFMMRESYNNDGCRFYRAVITQKGLDYFTELFGKEFSY